VSLTITSYLVIQGISPVIWGSLADAIGRRPIYIASFSVYILSNIVLSFSPNFTVLLLFRGLQSAGSASTVSIGEPTAFKPILEHPTDDIVRKWRHPRYHASSREGRVYQLIPSE
jgi:MFS family permease